MSPQEKLLAAIFGVPKGQEAAFGAEEERVAAENAAFLKRQAKALAKKANSEDWAWSKPLAGCVFEPALFWGSPAAVAAGSDGQVYRHLCGDAATIVHSLHDLANIELVV